MAFGLIPWPSSRTSNDDRIADRRSAQFNRGLLGFRRRRAFRRRFDSVTEGVSHQMKQRILEPFDQIFVNGGFLARQV